MPRKAAAARAEAESKFSSKPKPPRIELGEQGLQMAKDLEQGTLEKIARLKRLREAHQSNQPVVEKPPRSKKGRKDGG